MGKRAEKLESKSHTLPSSPAHSSSSSDFEFTVSLSPRKSSPNLCPADELFYKGQLLPLHLSPRLSMVRTLLSSSSSSSSSATTSRDSTGSSSTDSHSSFSGDFILLADCDSSRPSSVAEDDEFSRPNHQFQFRFPFHSPIPKRPTKYFSLPSFSSVFRKEPKPARNEPDTVSGSPVKRMSATAKEVIRKYLKKVRPLYEKLSQKQQQKMAARVKTRSSDGSAKEHFSKPTISQSFSGNLMHPRRRRCVSSCPSSMRSSPNRSGVISRSGGRLAAGTNRATEGSMGMYGYANSSSMEELQSAIQGAIAHCKNSLIQNKTMVSNEI